MVKIHWSFYLIIGTGVLVSSYKLDSQKFKLFIWLGYVFLTVGIAKAGIWFINRKKVSDAERRYVGDFARTGAIKGMPKYCQACGNSLTGHENFCSRCGAMLRRR